MNNPEASISIILPAYNESEALKVLLPKLRDKFSLDEIIVVDDGSVDDTQAACQANDIKYIRHPYNIGNGAAVKTGARSATGDILVFMDADGQHDPADIEKMVEKLNTGYDMVVGARDTRSQASLGRLFANAIYNKFASWLSGQKIDDLTSGLRTARAEKFREFLHLLPNGFSYPTTSTMAFLRSGYSVSYLPIRARKRTGKSHINLFRDGVRFLLIIMRVSTLYAPLKIFIPISAAIFTTGIIHYLYTYFTMGRFTNMSAVLLLASLLIFLIGLLSEQITMLLYQKINSRD